MNEQAYPHVYGVRHLSPSAAVNLIEFLNKIKPTAVLVEGLSDASDLIEHIVNEKTKPPVAVLAYTSEPPIRTIILPFAEYSPEYQALKWAKKNKAHAEFIDLPSDVFMKFGGYKIPNGEKTQEGGEEISRGNLYDKWAKEADCENFDEYWERFFERVTESDYYVETANAFGKGLRELSLSLGTDGIYETAETLLREAYMRRKVENVLESGHKPEKTVIVTGAFHVPAFTYDLPPMSDEEFASIPKINALMTLMPYSYYRLSSRSGYGAGNQSPEYFHLVWNHLKNGSIDKLPVNYFTNLARYMRSKGTYRSTAEIIEAVRLSEAMASIGNYSYPVLSELRNSAITCLGQGDSSTVNEAFAYCEIGTRIGSLPEGVSRTAIQDDFYRELKRLKLEKYKSLVAQDIDLDLRENRTVKSDELKFLDLQRSFFLNRLAVLKLTFQRKKAVNQDSATWKESWILQWTPEAEIELVESALKGESVEIATAYVLKERLESENNVEGISKVIEIASCCGMKSVIDIAERALQGLATEEESFIRIAAASSSLASTIQYGDLRKTDTVSLSPLLSQLFLKSSLILIPSSKCSNDVLKDMFGAINMINKISLDHYDKVDCELWTDSLSQLAARDDLNSGLSGYACAILMERNLMDGDALKKHLSIRLSPGMPADLGAGWFEGLTGRNRYVLISNVTVWEIFDGYIETLDNEQFLRALVFLRRALMKFSASEKRSVCEILAALWNVNDSDVEDIINFDYSEEEKDALASLDDFNFDDL